MPFWLSSLLVQQIPDFKAVDILNAHGRGVQLLGTGVDDMCLKIVVETEAIVVRRFMEEDLKAYCQGYWRYSFY